VNKKYSSADTGLQYELSIIVLKRKSKFDLSIKTFAVRWGRDYSNADVDKLFVTKNLIFRKL